jgi:hypothetical protein
MQVWMGEAGYRSMIFLCLQKFKSSNNLTNSNQKKNYMSRKKANFFVCYVSCPDLSLTKYHDHQARSQKDISK